MAEQADRKPDTATAEAAPVVPKPASTIVLARESERGGFEAFLVQRQASMGFMGGMHVFPGGKLCEADGSDAMRARIADPEHAARHDVWGEGVSAAEATARAVAAIRETFEEAGVLLCRDADHLPAERVAELRAALLGGEDFAALLGRAGLQLELARLVPLSRWITPERERTRFDTSFYVARAPRGQHAEHDRGESVAAAWLSPDAALAATAEGRIRLAPPTALTLESLRAAASVDAALGIAARQTPPTILPIIRAEGSEVVILYPGDPAHPVRTPALAGPTRRVLRRS
jgi:8-oxo-dGTP pyrophosphatase MutT (NUDIX family)